MSAKCQRDCLDGTKSRLLDPPHQVVAMQRFIELLGVDVECDAYFGVASDLAYPYGVQAQPDDQMRDERSTQVVRRYGRAAFAVQTRLVGGRNDALVPDVVTVGDSCRILFDY